jgi:7-carboxy-7-deazaguanine synthase
MFGNNPIKGLVKGDGTVLAVTEIFSTFQGEGPFVGYPAVFIRLSGCNLVCKFCDTEFDHAVDIDLVEIIRQIQDLAKNDQGNRVRNLVVITGGEPMRQPIEKLCEALIGLDFSVQIETNGTIYRLLNPKVSIVCSPKNTGKSYHEIREDLLANISALKFIISSSNKLYDHVAEIGQTKYNIPVYVQPMDEYDKTKNKHNMELTKMLSEKYGYRVSLQVHKIMNVR